MPSTNYLESSLLPENDWKVVVWDQIKTEIGTLAEEIPDNFTSKQAYTAYLKKASAALTDQSEARGIFWNLAKFDPVQSAIPKDVVSLPKAVRAADYHFNQVRVFILERGWGQGRRRSPPLVFSLSPPGGR